MNNPVALAIVFIVALVALVYGLAAMEKLWSRRERGISRKRRRKIGKHK